MKNRSQILVVDDHLMIRDFVSETLEEEGFRVTTAASGEEALEIFRRQAFPLVITDIHMGALSGLDLLAEVKRIAPATVVIVMSSDNSTSNLETAKGAGAFEFLAKPLKDLELLCTTVTRALESLTIQPEPG
ncbi:hypothetical protein DESUT3_28860 [Desulfuromonas versatilis]|uniref:Response regulatory domain-containing protein n=1 Tax=Desulfuromonas versatilis TaxID=2802975 RepID=A0ABM8HU19_9BACT|nr:response regulator [Desulfuromonas versatilis]BCR05817.1 hypothetical protein DESUT3_28860 [Desulfuromonas versatilis]